MISEFDNLVWHAVDSIGQPLSMSREQFFSLINAVIQKESTFNPQAVSWTGAGIGLMQVNPFIWTSVYGVTREQLFDPATNVMIGSQILKDYIQKYGTTGGLGAYFAGPSNRLSEAAKAYANKVISFYNTIRSRLQSLFTGSFTTMETTPLLYDLPETGTESGTFEIQGFHSPIEAENYTTPLLIGLGFLVVYLAVS